MEVPMILAWDILYLIEVEENEIGIFTEGCSIKLKDLRVSFDGLIFYAEVDAWCGEKGTSFSFWVTSITRVSTLLLNLTHHKLNCSL